MNAKVTLLCCLVAVAVARPDAQGGYGYPAPDKPIAVVAPKPEMGRPFEFMYAVKDEKSGVDYGHKSNSDGKVESGKYHVVLPDGRIQTVTYTADENGYHAVVTYEGEAKYPEPKNPEPKPNPPPALYGTPSGLYGTPN